MPEKVAIVSLDETKSDKNFIYTQLNRRWNTLLRLNNAIALGNMGSYEISAIDLNDDFPIFAVYDPKNDMNVGYANFINNKHSFEAETIAFTPEYQGFGLGAKFYSWLITKGITKTLMSGDMQSRGGRATWEQLAKAPGILVYGWDKEKQQAVSLDPNDLSAEDPVWDVDNVDDETGEPLSEYSYIDMVLVAIKDTQKKMGAGKTAGYTAYVLTDAAHNQLLQKFPPKFPDVIAHHVTYQFGVPADTPTPPPAKVEAVGYASDESLEAIVVSVDGQTTRKDGSTYHITLSLDKSKGRKAVDSNKVIKANGFEPITPFEIQVEPQMIGDPPKKTAAPAHADMKTQVFYHGTPDENNAQAILRDGIQPRTITMPDKAKSRAQLAPVPDRVYLTNDIKYAGIYALGGSMFGVGSGIFRTGQYTSTPEDWLKDKDPYGYIFEIDGSALNGDITPDEDSIGETVNSLISYQSDLKYLKAIENGTPERYKGQKESLQRGVEYGLKDPINQPGVPSQVIYELQNLYEQFATERMRFRFDEVAYQAQFGKKVQKRLSTATAQWLIDHGAHVAHQGALHPSKCWRFSKAKALLTPVTELQSILEAVPVSKTAAVPAVSVEAREVRVGDKLIGGQPFVVKRIIREGDEVVMIGKGLDSRRFGLDDMVSKAASKTASNTIRAYHGTTAAFETFNVPAMFHVNRKYAEDIIAGHPNGRVIEALLTIDKPADLAMLHISPSVPNFKDYAEVLEAEGYDGAQYKNEAWIAFHTDQIHVVKEKTAAAGMHPVSIDSLPRPTKGDIAYIIHDSVEWFQRAGYDEEDVYNNLFGLEDAPKVLLGTLPVEPLYATMNRSVSDFASNKYTEMLKDPGFEFDPIIVADGKHLEGGHRMEAYHRAGRATIPVVDITNLIHADPEMWYQWMNGENITAIQAFPLKTASKYPTPEGITFKTNGGVRFGFIIKAWLEDENIGHLLMKPYNHVHNPGDEISFFIGDVKVLEEFRERGIGLMLYKEAIRIAKSKGAKALYQGIPQTDVAANIWSRLTQEYNVKTNEEGSKFIRLAKFKTAAETMTQEPEIKRDAPATDEDEDYTQRPVGDKGLTPEQLSKQYTQIQKKVQDGTWEHKPQTPPAKKAPAKKRTQKIPTYTPPEKNKAFKAWFGDSKVSVSGKPQVVYHGTTHDFNEFETRSGNDEGHYGAGIYFTSSRKDVENYAGVGPDLTSRIEQVAERLVQEWEDNWDNDPKTKDAEFPSYGTTGYTKVWKMAQEEAKKNLKGSHNGFVMPCYLSMQNPVVVEAKGGTRIKLMDVPEYDEENDDYIYSDEYPPVYDAMRAAFPDYKYAMMAWESLTENGDEDITAFEFEKAIRESNIASYLIDDGGSAGKYILEVYKELGYDGVMQKNADVQFPGMKMDKGTTHYIIWNPTQVKSALGNAGTYDPSNPSITASKNAAEDELIPWDGDGRIGDFPGREPGGRLSQIIQVPMDKLEATEESLDELVVENLVNALKYDDGKPIPALVVEDAGDGHYYIVDGHHRFEAAKRVGYKTAPVRVWTSPDDLHEKTAGAQLFHVTETINVPKIRAKGLTRFNPSNWTTGDGERYGESEIYAFEEKMDAIRWAAKMDWSLNKKTGSGKISIVVFKKGGETWEVDNNDPLGQMSSKGRWLKTLNGIPKTAIIGAFPVTVTEVKELMKTASNNRSVTAAVEVTPKLLEQVAFAVREDLIPDRDAQNGDCQPVSEEVVRRLEAMGIDAYCVQDSFEGLPHEWVVAGDYYVDATRDQFAYEEVDDPDQYYDTPVVIGKTASGEMLTVYHVSQNEDFKLDINHKPKSGGVGEFYVTLQPDTWKDTFGREYVHAFKMPKDAIAYSPKDYPSMKELNEWAIGQGYMSMQEVHRPSGELVTESDNVTPMVRPELTEKAKALPFYGQKDPMRGGGFRFLELAYLKAQGFSAVESYYSPDGHEIAVFDTSCLKPIKTASMVEGDEAKTAGRKEWLGLALAPLMMAQPTNSKSDKPMTPHSFSETVENVPSNYISDDLIDRRHGEKPTLGEKAKQLLLNVRNDYNDSAEDNKSSQELERELKKQSAADKYTGPYALYIEVPKSARDQFWEDE